MYTRLKLLFLLIAIVDFNKIVVSAQNETETQKSEPSKTYQLPDDVKPSSYEVSIIPDLIKFTFSGQVKINITVEFATNQIELHSKDLTIKTCNLKGAGRSIDIQCKLDMNNDLLIIQPTQATSINKDAKYSLIIEFEGVLSNDMNGFYMSSYTMNYERHWLAITQFEPVYARRVFPCFDEPRFRAPFTISVAHLAHQTATSNMPIDITSSADSTNGNLQWTKFKETPPMPTYLVSFMVSEFTSVPNVEGKINVWTRKNVKQHTSYALKQSTKLLHQLEDYFGIPYELPKLDVIAVPDFNMGGMENWGMTTFRENYIIIDELNSAQIQKYEGTRLISHEFAHLWFGNLRTPGYWDFLWLKESFALYFEYFAVATIEPTWKADQLFVPEVVQSALWNEVEMQRAMTTFVQTTAEIEQLYDYISYEKGASVLRMLEHITSPITFQAVLRQYLNDGYTNHGGGVITPTYLFRAFNILTPPEPLLSQVLKTWTENIGFPLITITRNYDTGKIIITQKPYQSIRAPNPAPNQEWIVPLTYTTKSKLQFTNTQPSLWSFANEDTKLSNHVPATDWILFNIQHAGYYRVQYDKTNWQLLTDQLHQNFSAIHLLNRAQLLDDSLTLADDKQLDYRIALRLVQYLAKESEILPWVSALPHLDRMFSEFEGTQYQEKIQKFLQGVMQKPFEIFGFDIKTEDNQLIKIKKPAFVNLACKIQLNNCVSKALEEYKRYKRDLSKIQPDLKEQIYCVALKHSSNPQKEFENLWNEYLQSDIAFDKETILKSLKCSNDQKVHERLIKMLADSNNKDIRRQDEDFIFEIYSSNIYAANYGLDYIFDLLSNETKLLSIDDFGIETLNILIGYMAKKLKKDHLNTLDQMGKKLIKMKDKKYEILSATIHDTYKNTKQFIDNTKSNGELLLSELQLLNTDFSSGIIYSSSAHAVQTFYLWSCLIIYVIFFLSNRQRIM